MILAREEALATWAGLAAKPGTRLIVYLPYAKPTTPHAWQEDPFAPFELGGSVFPDGDGDTFKEICLKAYPTRHKEVRQLFDDGDPSFQAVDGLAGGAIWPTLRALFGLESERELLMALVEPQQTCKEQLEKPGPWLEESRRLVSSSLGFEVSGSAWVDFRESLGRFLLFSEFALDLPGELPASLAEVPRASEDRRSLVYALCGGLRDSRPTRAGIASLRRRWIAPWGSARSSQGCESWESARHSRLRTGRPWSAVLRLIRKSDFAGAGEILRFQESSLWYDDSSEIQALWACVRSGLAVLDGLSAFAAVREERRHRGRLRAGLY